jgi:cysteine desulfurase
MPAYFDCNATTPLDRQVRAAMLEVLDGDYGNAGSRIHSFGERAFQAVQRARERVADVVAARKHEVIFTSGATESNNLAILSLEAHGRRHGQRHLVSTQIEHPAVLEPLAELERRGFEVTRIEPTPGGWVPAEDVCRAVRPDTLLVSVMQVNNETGVRQPIAEIAAGLTGREALFHVDAAQGFGKDIETLRHPRIDLMSVTAHKIYGPQGVGALIARRHAFRLPPIAPLVFGGGQELGLRSGTLPTHLIVGMGVAAELALEKHEERARACLRLRDQLLAALQPLQPVIHGDQSRVLPHVLNLSLPGIDSEQFMEAVEHVVAISNGSACTSLCASASHVLTAMRIEKGLIEGAVRFSWCHTTPSPDWSALTAALQQRHSSGSEQKVG